MKQKSHLFLVILVLVGLVTACSTPCVQTEAGCVQMSQQLPSTNTPVMGEVTVQPPGATPDINVGMASATATTFVLPTMTPTFITPGATFTPFPSSTFAFNPVVLAEKEPDEFQLTESTEGQPAGWKKCIYTAANGQAPVTILTASGQDCAGFTVSELMAGKLFIIPGEIRGEVKPGVTKVDWQQIKPIVDQIVSQCSAEGVYVSLYGGPLPYSSFKCRPVDANYEAYQKLMVETINAVAQEVWWILESEGVDMSAVEVVPYGSATFGASPHGGKLSVLVKVFYGPNATVAEAETLYKTLWSPPNQERLARVTGFMNATQREAPSEIQLTILPNKNGYVLDPLVLEIPLDLGEIRAIFDPNTVIAPWRFDGPGG